MEKRSGFYPCTYSTSQSVIDWLFSMEVVIWWTLITYSTTAWNSTERKIIFCLTNEVYSWRIAGTQWQCAPAWNDQVNVMEYLTLHMLCKHLFWVLDHNPPSLRKDKLFLHPIKSRSDFERSFVEWGVLENSTCYCTSSRSSHEGLTHAIQMLFKSSSFDGRSSSHLSDFSEVYLILLANKYQ